ncbi:MAG: hypothetical protein AAFQ96_05570, partial [Pseudomonadota bacterium]
MVELLIDGDILCHRAAKAVAPAADEAQAAARLERMLSRAKRRVDAHAIVIALSDARCFRTEIDPRYKRARRRRPRDPLVDALRDRLRKIACVDQRAGLEADDVLGIRLTEPRRDAPHRVCLSGDKDLLTVPGAHVDAAGRLRRVTPAEAERRHLFQCLAGDASDGYPGCPGVGAKTAAAFLAAPFVASRRPDGRWDRRPTRAVWAGVVSLYRARGLDEREALRQARLARILRHGEIDLPTGRPRLWTPALLRHF